MSNLSLYLAAGGRSSPSGFAKGADPLATSRLFLTVIPLKMRFESSFGRMMHSENQAKQLLPRARPNNHSRSRLVNRSPGLSSTHQSERKKKVKLSLCVFVYSRRPARPLDPAVEDSRVGKGSTKIERLG